MTTNTADVLAEALHESYLRDPSMPRILWADLNDADKAMWRNHAKNILAALAARHVSLVDDREEATSGGVTTEGLREAAQRLVDVIFAEAQAEPFILPLRGMKAASDTRAALSTTPPALTTSAPQTNTPADERTT